MEERLFLRFSLFFPPRPAPPLFFSRLSLSRLSPSLSRLLTSGRHHLSFCQLGDFNLLSFCAITGPRGPRKIVFNCDWLLSGGGRPPPFVPWFLHIPNCARGVRRELNRGRMRLFQSRVVSHSRRKVRRDGRSKRGARLCLRVYIWPFELDLIPTIITSSAYRDMSRNMRNWLVIVIVVSCYRYTRCDDNNDLRLVR